MAILSSKLQAWPEIFSQAKRPLHHIHIFISIFNLVWRTLAGWAAATGSLSRPPDGTGLTCGQHIESHSCIFSFPNRNHLYLPNLKDCVVGNWPSYYIYLRKIRKCEDTRKWPLFCITSSSSLCTNKQGKMWSLIIQEVITKYVG
jgi:hypothetical protein